MVRLEFIPLNSWGFRCLCEILIMKSPNACLPTRRLAQQLVCKPWTAVWGAVGDLLCKELLFVSIYSNNASAGLRFKNACWCVCTCITPLLRKKKKKSGLPVSDPQLQLLSASLAAGSRFKIHILIAATGNSTSVLWVTVTGKIAHSRIS